MAGADAIIATVFPNSFFQFLEQAGQQGLRDQSQIITAQAPSKEVAKNLVSEDVAMRLADRTYALQNGEVKLSGDADELRERDEIREAYLGL